VIEQKRVEQEEKKRQEDRLRRTEEQIKVAVEKFESLSKKGKASILKMFREHLVELGNKTMVNNFDQLGVESASGAMLALFRVFLRDQYFDEESD